MHRLLVVCALLGLLLVACGNDNSDAAEDAPVRSAFETWGVGNDGVPAYEISNTLIDEPGELLSVEVPSDDWSDIQTQQVMADIIEDNRNDYAGVIVRVFEDDDSDLTGIYVETEDVMREIASDYGLDVNRANDAGYPLLMFQR